MARRGESIYLRKDGLWEARYVKEIDINGKKKYGSVYARTYREVKEKRQDALDRILLFQKPTTIRGITVEALAQEWLTVNQSRVKRSTLQRYQGFLKNHISPGLGPARVAYLSTVSIHEFAQNRLKAGLSPQSVNTVLVVLHSILKYGQRQYKLPLPEIVYLSVEKKEMRVLSPEEQKKLVAVLLEDMDAYKLGVLTALYTGLRIGELCALRWEDIDETCIKVRKTMQRLQKSGGEGTELFLGAPKSNSSLRAIPLPSFLRDLIFSFKNSHTTGEYFVAEPGLPITEPRVMQYKFQKYLRQAGVDKANFHALRHSFATRCVERGFEIKSLSEILGHASSRITVDRYVHSSLALKQANMELLSLSL